MDNMLEHPGIELQLLIKEKGLTQKAFASILGKKISEVNELLKGKRNITIQRDYLLHQTLGTPVKYWILKQIDYDYSLLDIEESDHNDVILSNSEESIATDSSFGTKGRILGKNKENTQDSSSQVDTASDAPQNDALSSSGTNVKDLRGKAEELDTQDSSSHHSSEGQKENKDDKDLKNRAQIFRNF